MNSELQPGSIIDVTEQNLQELLQLSTQSPVIFHFWASVSPESMEVIPQLKTLVHQYNGAVTLALLNCEEQQMIASQFGVQALPTLALFINGQPVDGLGGPQPIEAIETMLAKHLPSQDELTFQSALDKIQGSEYSDALSLILSLPEEFVQRGDVKLAYADCLLETQQFTLAKPVLDAIPLEYQDNYYKSLIAKLELHEQAANSPEIQSLEQQLKLNPNDVSKASELALQYHQVNRSEEALELIWPFLQKDLNQLDGNLKKNFIDILSVMGQGNSAAAKYRRQLYSLLY